MNIRMTLIQGLVILAALSSLKATAETIAGINESCQQHVLLGDENTDLTDYQSFASSCKSTSHYNYYDPYNPSALNSRYYLLEIQRDADISINISSYNTSAYLSKGQVLNGERVDLFNQYDNSAIFLTQGFYILELTNRYSYPVTTTFTLLDTSDDVCIKNITLDTPVNDGWHSDCNSNNRDYYDPYAPTHYNSFKAKYFTLELASDSDLRIQLNSNVNTYVYILGGDNEFALQIDSNSSNDFLKSLPQGTYTFEITTQDKYAPGTFSLLIENITSDSACQNDMVFDTTISNSYNQSCLIQSWNSGMDDPYAGVNPERAAYYDFTLESPANLTFNIYNTSQDKTVISLYKQGDYSQPIISNNSGNYYSSYLQNYLSKYLASGDYTIEVTKLDELAIGSYQFKVAKSDNVDCDTMEFNYESTDLISEQCYSLFREGDNSDPYSPQQGDYYAKRLEFSIEEPTSIYISQANRSTPATNYLAKKVNDGTFQVIATSDKDQGYYWNQSNNQSAKHCLSPGSYLSEFTTYYPEKTDTAYNVIRKINEYGICHYSLALNSTINTNLDSTSCESNHKSRVYNYADPYSGSSNYTEYYFSKTFSFYVDSDQTIDLEIESMDVGFDMFISKLSNSYTPVLIETSAADSTESNKVSLFLSKGMHQVEVTTQHPLAQQAKKPNFTLTIGDKNNIVEAFNSCSANIDFQFKETSYSFVAGETAELTIQRTDITTNETIKINIVDPTGKAMVELTSDSVYFKKGVSEKTIKIKLTEEQAEFENVLIELEGYGSAKINLLTKAAPTIETEPLDTEEDIEASNSTITTDTETESTIRKKKSGSISFFYLLTLFSLLLLRRR